MIVFKFKTIGTAYRAPETIHTAQQLSEYLATLTAHYGRFEIKGERTGKIYSGEDKLPGCEEMPGTEEMLCIRRLPSPARVADDQDAHELLPDLVELTGTAEADVVRSIAWFNNLLEQLPTLPPFSDADSA